jgi:hypothetical protein
VRNGKRQTAVQCSAVNATMTLLKASKSLSQKPKEVPIRTHTTTTKATVGTIGLIECLKPQCDSRLQSPTSRRQYLRRGSRAPSMLTLSGLFGFDARLLAVDGPQEQQHETRTALAATRHRRAMSLVSMLIPELQTSSLCEPEKKFKLSPRSTPRPRRPSSCGTGTNECITIADCRNADRST